MALWNQAQMDLNTLNTPPSPIVAAVGVVAS